MSNPLAAFRKYQKAMLAVAAVLAMLAFGILPVMSEWLGASGGGSGDATNDNPVVVSWNGGQLRESDIQNYVGRRQLIVNFQQAVQAIASQRGAQPRPVIVPQTINEQNVIETVMLADQAEKLGVVVSEEAVVQHLEGNLAGGTITGDELAAILQNATNSRLSQSQLIDGFKMEMAAHRMRVLANGGAFNGSILENASTPSQSLDYYKRLNRRMEAEVLEFPVADFVSQVQGEPTDAEINELYEEYKTRFPIPSQPEPGFREPTRITVNWVKADFPQFLEREIAKLTDEELRARYEETKEDYIRPTLPTDSDIDALISEENKADAEEESDGEEGEVDSEASTGEEDAGAEDEGDGGEGVQAEGELDDIDGADGAESSDDADSAGETETSTEETATVEYRPFEDVRDDIANQLARPKATDAVREAVTQAMDEMRKYFDDFTFWEATGDEGSEPPPAPKLTEMSSRLGLQSGELPMISFTEAGDYEIGAAFDYRVDANNRPQKILFAQKAFQPALPRFKPEVIFSSEADSQFVFWKTDQRDQFIPTLEEARPAIVKHWKMRKAFDLAKAAAEKVASQLKNSQQSLKTMMEADATKKVTDTGEFTWMTYGSTFSGAGEPRLSTVEGVEYAGEQFMKDASKLASGETTVTYNQPETKVYVVYVKAITSNEDDLRQLFLTDNDKFGVRLIAAGDEYRSARDWYVGLQEQLNVEVNERETAN